MTNVPLASAACNSRMIGGRAWRPQSAATARHAFTLIEVMFAVVAFCTATFVILGLVANSLSNTRRLQRPMVDAGVVASWLSQTNRLELGVHHKNLGDLLGDEYDNYTCTYDAETFWSKSSSASASQPSGTNKLIQVDFIVENERTEQGLDPVVSKMSILLFMPNMPNKP